MASSSEPITMGNYTDLPPEQRPGYMQQAQAASQYQTYAQPNVQYAQTGQYSYTAQPANQSAGSFQYAPTPNNITFTAKPVSSNSHHSSSLRYSAQPTSPPPAAPYPTQQTQQQSYYTAMPQPPPPPPTGQNSTRAPDHRRSPSNPGPSGSYDGRRVVEMTPQSGGRMNAPPSPGLRPHSLSVSGGRPEGITQRMDRLSVSGNRPDIQTIIPGGMPGDFPGGGGRPPPSPLLEAYHGTYQSLSPMPQAVVLDDDLDHLTPLDSLSPRASSSSIHGHRRAHSSSRRSPSPRRSKPKDKLAMATYGDGGRDREREKEKKARIYDAEDDAGALMEAIAARPLDADVLIDILPALSHDQMLELRNEYKRICKVQGRGINIAKHIKLKTSGNFGKIAYVTALGKYESEGYWANFWYQSGNARRELLIEALMGRQNHEIREIKESFKDKRYGDSLVKCMDKELKADKFRKAVLMALEGERQEESEIWEVEYRNRDVDTLYKAIRAKEGGETAMLNVVVLRSDAHLREVLRTYERKYQGNFARDALRKSNNLVGEVIAHILNGVINRPARDAMLLHHALMDLIEPADNNSKSSSAKHERQQRYELLISRLVRLHWDRLHMMRVKREYEDKYRRLVEEDVEEATKGDFREFCLSLCQSAK